MQRQHDRPLPRNLTEIGHHSAKRLGSVRVLGAMNGGKVEASRGQAQSPISVDSFCARADICSDVSYITSPTQWTPSRMPSAARFRTAVSVGQNSQRLTRSETTRLISSGIGRNARNPASTCATGTNSFAAARARGERRVGVAVDQHDVGLRRHDRFFERYDHPASHRTMTATVDAEMLVGLRDIQLLEEDVGHVAVEMLTGVNEHLADVRARAQGARHWRGLDELRPRADYRENGCHVLEIFDDVGNVRGVLRHALLDDAEVLAGPVDGRGQPLVQPRVSRKAKFFL